MRRRAPLGRHPLVDRGRLAGDPVPVEDLAHLGVGIVGPLQRPVRVVQRVHDAPGQPDGAYPAGFKALLLNFTANVFCVAGQDAGKFYGTIPWTWRKTKGGTPSVTIGSGTTPGTPDAAATGAISTWATNHGFTVPTPAP